MKEAISVACLSKRCYLWALSIMEAYKKWKTKHQGNNKINRMLFVQLPGLKKEETIFHLLRQFRGGELSKTEFNSRLKEEKVILMPKISQPSLLKKLSKIVKATKYLSLIVTLKSFYKNTLLWNRNLFFFFVFFMYKNEQVLGIDNNREKIVEDNIYSIDFY